MPINILMPALSPTMEKGNLAKWLKKEGDKVKSGDIIAEIETDKATMEDEAVDEGMLAKIVVPEGTADVPVNQLIAVLAGEGEDVKAAAAGAAAAAPQRRACRAKRGGRGLAAQAASAAPATSAQRPSPQPSPLRGERAGMRAAPPALRRRAKRTATAASSPRRWRGGSPRKPASTSPASPAPGRTAA